MTTDMVLDILAIAFGAGGVLTFFINLRRSKAQNTLDLSTAWEKFSAPLLQRVEQLEQKNTDLENLVHDLRGWAERLSNQVKELGGVPVPFITRKKITGPLEKKEI